MRTPITDNDLGRYRCVATNSLGSNSCDAIVKKDTIQKSRNPIIYGFIEKKHQNETKREQKVVEVIENKMRNKIQRYVDKEFLLN
jgi:hypothetical protein